MPKYHLYLDTSVFGALFDTEAPARVALTRTTLGALRGGAFATYIGVPVLEEIGRAPRGLRSPLEKAVADLGPSVLEEDEVSARLTEAYLAAGVLGRKSRNDARHIALASVAGLDGLVSWNFRHMVNLEKKRRVHEVNLRYGFALIDIISPQEVPRE
ncbi:MAG TPA: hypothetical protein VFI25_09285 [Planctomycetota bacterium]|nr:hypothetical protein [Planctomycetota bacterium]